MYQQSTNVWSRSQIIRSFSGETKKQFLLAFSITLVSIKTSSIIRLTEQSITWTFTGRSLRKWRANYRADQRQSHHKTRSTQHPDANTQLTILSVASRWTQEKKSSLRLKRDSACDCNEFCGITARVNEIISCFCHDPPFMYTIAGWLAAWLVCCYWAWFCVSFGLFEKKNSTKKYCESMNWFFGCKFNFASFFSISYFFVDAKTSLLLVTRWARSLIHWTMAIYSAPIDVYFSHLHLIISRQNSEC